MKKSYIPPKDPDLRKLLEQFESPELPEGFSKNIMTSIRSMALQKKNKDLRIPIGIKIGIPLFIVACAILITIFPGNQQDPINSFFNNFSFSALPGFFERISEALQSYRLPDIQISKKATYYILGGIGLVWMFLLSERISRSAKKSES